MDENKLAFNSDEKKVLLKSLKDLSYANSQLHQWVESDELTEGMSKTLPSLIESHFSTAAKILNYESHLLEEKEKRYVEIRTANIKIRELEEKLGSNKPVDGLKEQLKHLREVLSEWWSEKGFNHIGDEAFMPYGGLHARYSFMLEYRSSLSDTPDTDRRNREEHIEDLRKTGFEFNDNAKDSSEKLHLIDNPTNRKLLRQLLQGRFPSAEIHKVNSMVSRHDEDLFIIWDFDAIIRDLTDI